MISKAKTTCGLCALSIYSDPSRAPDVKRIALRATLETRRSILRKLSNRMARQGRGLG
jgi:hypothetical protein